jgi:hypothetical protein
MGSYIDSTGNIGFKMNCYTYFGHVRGVVKYKVYFPFSSLV